MIQQVTNLLGMALVTNMIPSIEQHVEWIADCIASMDERQIGQIEVTAETEWVAQVNATGDFTLLPTCNSWHLGANVPGKPRVFMPYPDFPKYVKKCNEVAADNYVGFALS